VGQYYYIINLDKRQYLHPHKFGDGLKLMEFGNSAEGTMTGLAVLLADGNGRGGGDIQSDDSIVGSWAGDRIVIAGDYADGGKFLPKDATQEELQKIADDNYSQGYNKPENVTLHVYAAAKFKDISDDVIRAIRRGEGKAHRLSQLDLRSNEWRHPKEGKEE